MIEGTRYATTVRPATPASRRVDRSYTRDIGLLPSMTGAVVFAGNPATAIGSFGMFQAGQIILVEGTNLNNGLFLLVSATSDTLTLAPPPSAEAAASCIIRAVRNVFGGAAATTGRLLLRNGGGLLLRDGSYLALR